MNSIYIFYIRDSRGALRHFEMVKGYLISATRPSKYSTCCPVENTTWGGVHVLFPRRLLVFTIITIAHERSIIHHCSLSHWFKLVTCLLEIHEKNWLKRVICMFLFRQNNWILMSHLFPLVTWFLHAACKDLSRHLFTMDCIFIASHSIQTVNSLLHTFFCHSAEDSDLAELKTFLRSAYNKSRE